MTHTVEGWAVQWRRNSRGKWFWHLDISGIEVFVTYLMAENETKEYAAHLETRIVRVRQTTEVKS
jgi:hypothetical protein